MQREDVEGLAHRLDVAEYEFRYNNRSANGVGDAERSRIALRSARGKRLTYGQPNL